MKKLLCLPVLLCFMVLFLITGCGKTDNFSGTWSNDVGERYPHIPYVDILKIEKTDDKNYMITFSEIYYDDETNEAVESERKEKCAASIGNNKNQLVIHVGWANIPITYNEKDKSLNLIKPESREGNDTYKSVKDIESIKAKVKEAAQNKK
jgi:hypothetical protein